MNKSLGVLWGIVFVFIFAWNGHAMPWKPTDLYNPLGNSIAIENWRWNRIGWRAFSGSENVFDQQIKFFPSRKEMGFALPEWVEPKTVGTSSQSLTRLSKDSTFSGSTLNSSDSEKNSNSIPEPATILIFGGGLIGIAIVARKKFSTAYRH